MLSHSNNT